MLFLKVLIDHSHPKGTTEAVINTKPIIGVAGGGAVISIARNSYIKDVFIPFLSNLTFFSKKN